MNATRWLMMVTIIFVAMISSACASGWQTPRGMGELRGLHGMTLEEAFPDSKARALIEAALDEDAEEAKRLVEAGADPNYAGKKDFEPLFWVFGDSGGDIEPVEILLDVGADPTAPKAKSSGTFLHWAASSERTELLRFLLSHGVDVNAPDRGGDTPLHSVAGRARLNPKAREHIGILLEAGADINALNNRGDNVADAAVVNSQFDLAIWLLEKGIDEGLRNLASASEIVRIDPESDQCEAKRELVNMLRERGVDFPVRRIHPNAPVQNPSFDPCLPDWHPQEYPSSLPAGSSSD